MKINSFSIRSYIPSFDTENLLKNGNINPFLIVKKEMEAQEPGKEFTSYEVFLNLVKQAKRFEDFEEEEFWEDVYRHIAGNEKIIEGNYLENCNLYFALSRLEKEILSPEELKRNFTNLTDQAWEKLFEKAFDQEPIKNLSWEKNYQTFYL